jgi:acrylyl-CoA reductase (NADPH)
LTGGTGVDTTVFPFILRGINLLGIDSVQCPMELRRKIWGLLAKDWKPKGLSESIAHVLPFEQLPSALEKILKGNLSGRTVIQIGQE